MRLSYYGGGHYDSIVGADHRNHLLTSPPGTVEKSRIDTSRTRATYRDFEETKQQSDVAATEAAELDLALEASRSDFDCQAEDLEALFSQELTWATSQADMESTNTELVNSIAAASAREHDEANDAEELRLALAASQAEAGGASTDDLERALALSQADCGGGGASGGGGDDLQRALALSAAETGPGLDPELELALQVSKEQFPPEEEIDIDLERAIQASHGL